MILDSVIEGASYLDERDRGRYLCAVVDYLSTGEVPDLKGALMGMFVSVRPALDNSAKRADAGRKGGKQSTASAGAKPGKRASKTANPGKQDPDSAEAEPGNGGSKTANPGKQNPESAQANRKQTGSKPEAKPEIPASELEREREEEREKMPPCGGMEKTPAPARGPAGMPAAFSGGASPMEPNPPSGVAEVREYCECDAPFCDPEDFFDSFAARGWHDAKGVAVVDWRAKARRWSREERDKRMRREAEEAEARKRSAPKPRETDEQRVKRLEAEFAAKHGGAA